MREKQLTLQRTYHYPADMAPVIRRVAELCGGEALLARLQEAVEGGETIVVYGDYDADGILATYILYTGLQRLAPGTAAWFINDRVEDGYNITESSMQKCLAANPEARVLITCDNGINAAEAVAYARECGVTVLVTDHHVQTIPLPADCPAIDEQSLAQRAQDEAAGITPEAFCGAELARRVITELIERLGRAEEAGTYLESLYPYAAVATITDHVPMNPSNHALGRKGLQQIREDNGFWKLLQEEAVGRGREVHGDTIGFSYGPLINASGRMTGRATHAMQMLLSYEDGKEETCRAAIRALVALNEERKELCRHDDAIALRKVEEEGQSKAPFLLLWGEEFSEGVNGLTATHLVETYRVPAAVLSPAKNDPGRYKGSARSVAGADVNLVELLQAHGDLIRAGGHAMAAGLSIREEDLETVRALLCEDLKDLRAPAEPAADFVYETKDLTMADADAQKELIAQLEPFGPGFEEPRIEVRGPVWGLWEKNKKGTQEKIHAAFGMGRSADGYGVQAMWWNRLEDARRWYEKGKTLRCLGRVERNEYTSYATGEIVRSIQVIIDEILDENA